MNISITKSKILVLLFLLYLYVLGLSYFYKTDNNGYKIYPELFTTSIINKEEINKSSQNVYQFTFYDTNEITKVYRLVSEKEYNLYKIGDEYIVRSEFKKNQFPLFDLIIMIYTILFTILLIIIFSKYVYWLFYHSETITFSKYLKSKG